MTTVNATLKTAGISLFGVGLLLALVAVTFWISGTLVLNDPLHTYYALWSFLLAIAFYAAAFPLIWAST